MLMPSVRISQSIHSYNMLKKQMSPTGDPNYKFSSATTLLYAAEASSQAPSLHVIFLELIKCCRCGDGCNDQPNMGCKSAHVHDTI